MKDVVIKCAPTLFLKAAIVFIGAAVLVLCFFLFPSLWQELQQLPEYKYVIYLALAGFYATPVPFFIALYQGFVLLQHIDKNNAFSNASVQALKSIKYCAIAIGILYAAGMPLVYVLAELDDAPGAILMGLAIIMIPFIVATFAAVLQKLVQSAVAMKSEHDLTV